MKMGLLLGDFLILLFYQMATCSDALVPEIEASKNLLTTTDFFSQTTETTIFDMNSTVNGETHFTSSIPPTVFSVSDTASETNKASTTTFVPYVDSALRQVTTDDDSSLITSPTSPLVRLNGGEFPMKVVPLTEIHSYLTESPSTTHPPDTAPRMLEETGQSVSHVATTPLSNANVHRVIPSDGDLTESPFSTPTSSEDSKGVFNKCSTPAAHTSDLPELSDTGQTQDVTVQEISITPPNMANNHDSPVDLIDVTRKSTVLAVTATEESISTSVPSTALALGVPNSDEETVRYDVVPANPVIMYTESTFPSSLTRSTFSDVVAVGYSPGAEIESTVKHEEATSEGQSQASLCDLSAGCKSWEKDIQLIEGVTLLDTPKEDASDITTPLKADEQSAETTTQAPVESGNNSLKDSSTLGFSEMITPVKNSFQTTDETTIGHTLPKFMLAGDAKVDFINAEEEIGSTTNPTGLQLVSNNRDDFGNINGNGSTDYKAVESSSKVDTSSESTQHSSTEFSGTGSFLSNGDTTENVALSVTEGLKIVPKLTHGTSSVAFPSIFTSGSGTPNTIADSQTEYTSTNIRSTHSPTESTHQIAPLTAGGASTPTSTAGECETGENETAPIVDFLSTHVSEDVDASSVKYGPSYNYSDKDASEGKMLSEYTYTTSFTNYFEEITKSSDSSSKLQLSTTKGEKEEVISEGGSIVSPNVLFTDSLYSNEEVYAIQHSSTIDLTTLVNNEKVKKAEAEETRTTFSTTLRDEVNAYSVSTPVELNNETKEQRKSSSKTTGRGESEPSDSKKAPTSQSSQSLSDTDLGGMTAVTAIAMGLIIIFLLILLCILAISVMAGWMHCRERERRGPKVSLIRVERGLATELADSWNKGRSSQAWMTTQSGSVVPSRASEAPLTQPLSSSPPLATPSFRCGCKRINLFGTANRLCMIHGDPSMRHTAGAVRALKIISLSDQSDNEEADTAILTELGRGVSDTPDKNNMESERSTRDKSLNAWYFIDET